jgi:hypothetical protein
LHRHRLRSRGFGRFAIVTGDREQEHAEKCTRQNRQ